MLNVRVEGRLVFSAAEAIVQAALDGFDLTWWKIGQQSTSPQEGSLGT